MCQSAGVELDVTTRDEGGRAVVSATGEVDVFTVPRLDDALTALTSAGRTDVVVDLSGVDFLDSTGLSVLVKAQQTVQEAGGKLAVVVTAERVAKVFRITGLDQTLALHPTLDAALGA